MNEGACRVAQHHSAVSPLTTHDTNTPASVAPSEGTALAIPSQARPVTAPAVRKDKLEGLYVMRKLGEHVSACKR